MRICICIYHYFIITYIVCINVFIVYYLFGLYFRIFIIRIVFNIINIFIFYLTNNILISYDCMYINA